MWELNTITYSDFTKNAEIKWLDTFEQLDRPAYNSGIFKVMDVPLNTGEVKEFSEIDREQYASVKGQGSQASRARVQQGYTKTMRVRRYAKDIGITVEDRKFSKYQEVNTKLTSLADMVPNRMELNLSHRIGFAASTSMTDKDGVVVDLTLGDSLALASPSHTVRGASTTYRNILAGNPVFSRGSLEAMERLAAEESINQFGEKVSVSYDIIWSTDDPTTVNAIKEFLASTASVEAGQNNGVTNVYRGKYRHVILPRVATDKDGLVDTTKRKYWGLVSSQWFSAYVGVWEQPFLKAGSVEGGNGVDFSTEDWMYGTAGSWGECVVSARGFLISKGDGT